MTSFILVVGKNHSIPMRQAQPSSLGASTKSHRALSKRGCAHFWL